jgi:glycosyltransferase involved in cell wall biosynthesis
VPDGAAPSPRDRSGRRLRLAHLTTVDMSLALLLRTELQVDVERGFETFGISAPGPYVGQVEELGVTHVAVPSLTRAWDLRRDGRAVRELAAALRRIRPDVLHTHNPKTGVIGRLLGRALGVPVVVNTCHGLWLRPGDPFAKRALVLGAETVAATASHAEMYQNAEDLRTLRRVSRAASGSVVGNGVDLDRFRPDPEGAVRVRRELGVGPDELLVGAVGRLVAEKGVEEYAAAARRLAGKARFVWVGPRDGDKPDAITSVDGVQLVGERQDMPAVYSALDVFVLPSHREGFSRSGMEAAACARPMVLTDIRGCREVGRDDEHLLLVPPRDDAALTAALERLLTDPCLRERLGSAARDRAAAEFDQRSVAAASIETYVTVARRRRLGWRNGALP